MNDFINRFTTDLNLNANRETHYINLNKILDTIDSCLSTAPLDKDILYSIKTIHLKLLFHKLYTHTNKNKINTLFNSMEYYDLCHYFNIREPREFFMLHIGDSDGLFMRDVFLFRGSTPYRDKYSYLYDILMTYL